MDFGLGTLGTFLGLVDAGANWWQGMQDRQEMQRRFQAGESLYGGPFGEGSPTLTSNREALTGLLSGNLDTWRDYTSRIKGSYDELAGNLQGAANTYGVQNIQASDWGSQQSQGAMNQLINSIQGTYGGLKDEAMDRATNLINLTKQDYAARTEEGMKQIEKYGQERAADIEAGAKRTESKGTQDLISRGLSNSTLLPGMRQSVEKQKQADLRREEGEIARLKSDVFQNLSGDQAAAVTGARNTALNTLMGTGMAGANALANAYGGQANAANQWAQIGTGARQGAAATNYGALTNTLQGAYDVWSGGQGLVQGLASDYAMMPWQTERNDVTQLANYYLGAPAPLAVGSPFGGASNSLMTLYGMQAMKPEQESNLFGNLMGTGGGALAGAGIGALLAPATGGVSLFGAPIASGLGTWGGAGIGALTGAGLGMMNWQR